MNPSSRLAVVHFIVALGVGTLASIAMEAQAQLNHPTDLSLVNVSVPGTTFSAESQLGRGATSSAGDVNGDGYSDFFLETGGSSAQGRIGAGQSYIVFGSALGAGGSLSLSTLSGGDGVIILGAHANDVAGVRISGAGDVNGDGFEDFLVGAQTQDPTDGGPSQTQTGMAYLIFGSSASFGVGGRLDLLSLDWPFGVRFDGANVNDSAGGAVSGAGDINGDGFADILIGAPLADQPTGDAGVAYLVYGSASEIGSGGVLNLGSLSGNDGVLIVSSVAGESAGESVSGVGDFNGDGFDDLIVSKSTSGNGRSYLIYGRAAPLGTAGVLDIATLDGSDGVEIEGAAAGDVAGRSVSGAGDVNGDGLSDIVIGAPGVGSSSPTAQDGSGQAYIILGSVAPIGVAGLVSLATDATSVGVIIEGFPSMAQAGVTVAGGGDVNGDGFGDILIGTEPAGPGVIKVGRSYLVYGSASGVGSAGVLNISSLDGTNGIRFDGELTNTALMTLAGAGDINGDGLHDVLISDFLNKRAFLVHGVGPGGPGYQSFTRSDDAPRTGVGMIGDGSHSIPLSRAWVDFSAGDDGAGGATTTTIVLQRVPSSTFAPLEVEPQFEWIVDTARQGYGTAGVTFKGTGIAGETNWNGLLLKSTDGGATWFAPSDQVRNSALHEITLPAETFPGRYALVVPQDESGPTVVEAVYNDDDDDGVVEVGESVTLIMSAGVIVRAGQVSASSFFLPVSGDSLGGGGFAVAVNPFSSRQIVITLGAGASLTVAGTFGTGAASGIDIAAGLAPTAIQSLAGVPAVDGGIAGVDDSGADLLFTLVTNLASIGAGGGTVGVTQSPNAAYTDHAITIAPGSLPAKQASAVQPQGPPPVTFTLQPPPVNLGVVGAVQITASTSGITFNPAATLTIEYRESDVDVELGQREEQMRVHQLVGATTATLEWKPLPGVHTVDTVNNLVTIQLDDLNPLGTIGQIGIFANIAGETIQRNTITMAPSPGSIVQIGPGTLTLAGKTTGTIYNRTRIIIPGYQLTSGIDPNRIEMTIEAPKAADRIPRSGGQGFPSESSALFVVRTADAQGQPFAFTSRVTLEVEFLDGTFPGLEGFDDVVNLGGTVNPGEVLRVVHDTIDGPDVNFEFVSRVPQYLMPSAGGGIIQVPFIENLTGPSGKGVWGVALVEPGLTKAERWELYE